MALEFFIGTLQLHQLLSNKKLPPVKRAEKLYSATDFDWLAVGDVLGDRDNRITVVLDHNRYHRPGSPHRIRELVTCEFESALGKAESPLVPRPKLDGAHHGPRVVLGDHRGGSLDPLNTHRPSLHASSCAE